MSADPPVRLGLIGCGWIARCRLRQLGRSGIASVTALLDVDSAAIAKTLPLAPSARVLKVPGEMTRDLVDAVMISTPSALHGAQALAVLRRGLPVFVQKPLALSSQELTRVLTAAAEKDLPIDTDFCYRHLRSAVALRNELRRGTIGTPFYVEGCFHNAYRPGAGWSGEASLAGGGALIDLGIHLLDLVGWLTDEAMTLEDAHLVGRGVPVTPGDIEDFATLGLRLRGGAEARLAASWDASTGRDAQIGLRIYGDSGCLLLSNRGGSFYDFDAWHFQGTCAEHLAADDGDQWQAGPLRSWLGRVAAGAGYQHLPGAITTMAVVDQAYQPRCAARTRPRSARGTLDGLGNAREF